jgi:hypothetical protein
MKEEIRTVDDVPIHSKFIDYECMPYVDIPGVGLFSARRGILQRCPKAARHVIEWHGSPITREDWLEVVERSKIDR